MADKAFFNYGEDRLTAGIALEIANGNLRGKINEKISSKIEKSFQSVRSIVERKDTVYGVNTGFGSLCKTKISPEDTAKLQYNILRSHSCGVGENIDTEIAKLMMILKVHALSFGFSGVARSTLDRIIWHIDHDVISVVPSQGSVGASGDLAPLSHLFLPLIGLGYVEYKGKIIETEEVLTEFDMKPLVLGPKEGLALINGTQFIAAHAVKAVAKIFNCLEHADIIGAMSLEALLGSGKPFAEELHKLRPYQGTSYVAYRLRSLLEGSKMVESHKDCGRVQDPYSLRCMPQVHGASRNAWLHLKQLLEVELNSVTDNPIIFDEFHTISGGNFHGQPLALPIDYAAFATSEIGNISDRRTYLMLEGGYNGLPELLMKNTGINSGFMIPQYTSASLVTENKTLCFPASADSVPTSLGQEDHVSMGSVGVRKLHRIITNLENILAVELLCSAQAFDFREPLKSSHVIEECHNVIRQIISHADEDRVFGEDLKKTVKLIREGYLVKKSYEISEKHNINLKGGDYELFGIY